MAKWLDRTINEAMADARAQIKNPTKSWDGLCQSFCRDIVYDVPVWAPSAIEAWGKIPRAHRIMGNVFKMPRGSLLYYAIGKHGHVAVASKRLCISNDYVRQGKIDYAPRNFPRWGVKFLGASFWTPYGILPH